MKHTQQPLSTIYMKNMSLKTNIPVCMLAAGCITSSLYCLFVRNVRNDATKRLESLLDDKQTQLYYNIMKERRNIFIFGKIVGLIVGYLFITYRKLDGWCKYCIFIVIVKFIACLVYLMFPKSDYFLRHVKTPEQASAWVDVYVEMRYNIFFGFVLGMIGYCLLIRFIS